jgi:hypothetical protein
VRQVRVALWLFEQTTPSRFARHPSKGGEFFVLHLPVVPHPL